MIADLKGWLLAYALVKRWLLLAIVGLLIAMAVPAFAAEVTVTTGSDNSAVLVEFGTCAGSSRFGTKLGQFTMTAPQASANIEMQPGTYCFRAARIDQNGVRQAWGATRQRTVSAIKFELDAP